MTNYHKWMGEYPDNYLSELSIPGSHDSVSYIESNPYSRVIPFMGGLARTQNGSIADQLANGVRFLDLRIRSVGTRLYGYHGGTPQIELGTALASAKQFLSSNPSEGLIINLAQDGGFKYPNFAMVSATCATTNTLICGGNPIIVNSIGVDVYDTQYISKSGNTYTLNPSDDNFYNNLRIYLDKFEPSRGYFTNREIPKVSDIQGKIMLVTNQSDVKSEISDVAFYWGNGYSADISLGNGTSIQTQNNWDLFPEDKYTLVHKTMSDAWDDNDNKKLYLNFASTAPIQPSGLPMAPSDSAGYINKQLNSMMRKGRPYSKLGIVAYDYITNFGNIIASELSGVTIDSNKDYGSNDTPSALPPEIPIVLPPDKPSPPRKPSNLPSEMCKQSPWLCGGALEKAPDLSSPSSKDKAEMSTNNSQTVDVEVGCKGSKSKRHPGKLITKCTHEQDRVIGTKHSDIINARRGNDHINPGKGSDVVTGGKGIDTFVISPGRTRIKDFRSHEYLMVELDRFNDVNIKQKGDDVLIKIKGYSTTILENFQLNEFDTSCIIPASGISLV